MTSPKAKIAIGQPAPDKVGKLARAGALWSTGFIAFRQVFGLVVTSILARLLLPSDYGLIGMVSTMFALFSSFSDLGLSTAAIQRKDLTEAQSHNLFWVNVAVGLLLSLVSMAMAPVLASFYGEDRLVPVTMIMGVSYAMNGLSVQPLALMRRQMQFKHLTLMQLAQFSAGAIVAIALAWTGAGYWALVAQAVTVQVLGVAMAFLVSRYRPRLPRRGVGTIGLLRFGGYLSAVGVMFFLQTNVDLILIGRILGPETLGYYTRASFLMLLPTLIGTASIGSVMIPSLSGLQQEPERLGSAYRKAVRWIAGLAFPIGAGLALVSNEAVLLVYGEQWLPVVPILRWLSVAGMVLPIFYTHGWLFTVAGKGRAYFVAASAATIVLVSAFAIGISWGVVGVAAWYAFAMAFLVTVPMLHFAHRAARQSFPRTMMTLIPAATAVSVMAAGILILGTLLEAGGVTWTAQLGFKVVAGAAIYVPIWMLLDVEVRHTFSEQWRSRIWPTLSI